MSIRVTSNVLINRSIRDINANLRRLQELQQQISSGKRISRPSDDPVGTTRAMQYTSDLDKLSIYQTNIRDGSNRLKATERVLESILTTMIEIQSTVQESLNVSGSLETATLSSSINGLLEEMIQNANAKFQGRFIFGGMETLSGTSSLSSPFNAVYDANGVISGVIQNPNGINDLIDFEISEGQRASINISGAAPFQPNGEGAAYDVFQTLINIRDALDSNDLATVSQELNNLETEHDTIISQASLVGSKINFIERQSVQHAGQEINLKEVLSATVDLDLARAIIEESYQQYLYQASLKVGARIIPASLMDFI